MAGPFQPSQKDPRGGKTALQRDVAVPQMDKAHSHGTFALKPDEVRIEELVQVNVERAHWMNRRVATLAPTKCKRKPAPVEVQHSVVIPQRSVVPDPDAVRSRLNEHRGLDDSGSRGER